MIDHSLFRTVADNPFDAAAYAVIVRPLTVDEGGGWFASLPDLPGCHGDGHTESEAITDVRLAALEWAHAAHEHDDPIPEPSFALQHTEAAE